MEMQQAELFNARSPRTTVGRHLRLVQPFETVEWSKPASPIITRYQPHQPRVGDAVSPVTFERMRSQEGGLKVIAPEHVERFLNHLRGEALLIGALCYDLGLRLSQLRFLRIRDVNLTARVIELSDEAKPIPASLYEDLRDHISEKMCSRSNGHVGQKRDLLLFSHEAFEDVLRVCASSFAEAQRAANDDGASALRISMARSSNADGERRGVRDNFLRVMGWFVAKKVSKRGARVQSPLGLFDKGPKIVRRDRGGVVHSYYLWRAVYSR